MSWVGALFFLSLVLLLICFVSIIYTQQAKEVNPKMTVEGLPPNWAAYMDMKTKYAYFYNKHSGKSSWINPKGSSLSVKGLPAGWDALQEKGGKDYYVNIKSGRCLLCHTGRAAAQGLSPELPRATWSRPNQGVLFIYIYMYIYTF